MWPVRLPNEQTARDAADSGNESYPITLGTVSTNSLPAPNRERRRTPSCNVARMPLRDPSVGSAMSNTQLPAKQCRAVDDFQRYRLKTLIKRAFQRIDGVLLVAENSLAIVKIHEMLGRPIPLHAALQQCGAKQYAATIHQCREVIEDDCLCFDRTRKAMEQVADTNRIEPPGGEGNWLQDIAPIGLRLVPRKPSRGKFERRRIEIH